MKEPDYTKKFALLSFSFVPVGFLCRAKVRNKFQWIQKMSQNRAMITNKMMNVSILEMEPSFLIKINEKLY